MAENNHSSDGWRIYHEGDDPRPDIEWSGWLHDEAKSGPSIASADETGEPLFLVWWSYRGRGQSRITHWRELPPEFRKPLSAVDLVELGDEE